MDWEEINGPVVCLPRYCAFCRIIHTVKGLLKQVGEASSIYEQYEIDAVPLA